MSIKIQKFLVFIPIINGITLFVLSCKLWKTEFRFRRQIRIFAKLFLALSLPMILQMIVDRISTSEILYQTVWYIVAYLQLLALSAVGLWEQIILENERN